MSTKCRKVKVSLYVDLSRIRFLVNFKEALQTVADYLYVAKDQLIS